MNGIGKLFFCVIGVSTKPGCTSVTAMFAGSRSMRRPSMKVVSAALLAL